MRVGRAMECASAMRRESEQQQRQTSAAHAADEDSAGAAASDSSAVRVCRRLRLVSLACLCCVLLCCAGLSLAACARGDALFERRGGALLCACALQQ